MADGGPADRLRSPKKDDGERVRQTSWDEKKLARGTKPQHKYTRWKLGGCSKIPSYVQGHRNVDYMDATFAFLSYLKLPAHGYAKTPFLV